MSAAKPTAISDTQATTSSPLDPSRFTKAKYPAVFDRDNLGQMPNDALFHGETTALLRAAKKRGGTLAGQTLTVFTDRELCNNCERVLPYVGLELGNPTVTFVEPDGSIMTMWDGAWIVGRTK